VFVFYLSAIVILLYRSLLHLYLLKDICFPNINIC